MRLNLIILLFFCHISFAQNELTHVVYFDTDKYEVPPTEESRLLLFMSTIDTLDIEKISIYGFCDDRGTENYNMVLSQNRADAIKTLFANSEFDESVITNVNGKGEILLKIVKENNVSKIRGLNRKVEIIVKPKPEPQPEPVKEKAKKSPTDQLKGNLKAGDKIVFDNLLFKTGYSYLTPESKKTLAKIADILVERDNVYFTIEGHVCCTQNSRDAVDRKTKKRNLSVARAKYIYDYLAKKGVSERRMKYVGMRRKFPLGGDPKFDRRVEIHITYVGEKS
ncbi:OmpA family protein [Mangrovimonas aestuarii]|uniref:OmpA family protein n=1 Tax=Mangrovimonas aestuarii TaxID=3018443 RepID=UPI002378DDC5|nr:OmpA family protein [Mangrovimonas aestuarii]